MFTLFTIAALLVTGATTGVPKDTEADSLPTSRLAGTWVGTARFSPHEKMGVFESLPSLVFNEDKSFKSLTPAFVEKDLEFAPIHIGSLCTNDGNVLYLIRGRIGFLEIGSTVGGGVPTAWEQMHLIRAADPKNDILIIGSKRFNRSHDKIGG